MTRLLMERLGTQRLLVFLGGMVVLVALMNLWFFTMMKRTKGNAGAFKRGLTAYMLGGGAVFVLALNGLELWLKGWGREALWIAVFSVVAYTIVVLQVGWLRRKL